MGLQLVTKNWGVYITLWLGLTTTIIRADVYDFIIVGGGTAGCVLANRLSANEAFSVLLLEEGERQPEALSIPANAPKYVYESGERYIFTFDSVPQEKAGLETDGVQTIRTAKILGGGSSLNSMRFNRGSPEAFNHWASVSGDNSWRYSSMLKYFKRIETYKGQFDSDQHGHEGPITISSQSYALDVSNWLAAGHELGYSVADPNGPEQVSFTPIEYSMKRGHRISAYTGYIQPIEADRENLKIITEATVKRVIFEGLKATGVIYTTKDGENVTVSAYKEVILSAGSFGSSKLLLLSGVGPAEDLEQVNIPLIKDLPVGENLQAAPFLTVQFVVNDSSMVLEPSRDLNPDNWKLYEETGEGPYSTVLGYAGQGFLASPGEGAWPDVEVVFRPANVPMEPWKNVELEEGEVVVLIWFALTRTKSGRGRLSLNPDNPTGKPLSDWNFFEDSRDIDAYLWVINEVFRIMKSKAFEKLSPRYLEDPLPSCGNEEFLSESYWKCYIRQLTTVTISPSGTCSLGHVVNSELKVKGVRSLRVVDASVIPLQANINLMAEVYALAEKASEMIMEKWENSDEGLAVGR